MRTWIFEHSRRIVMASMMLVISMVLPLALHAQSIEESLDPGKMYLFTHSAQAKAFYEGSEWSMRFSGTDSLGVEHNCPVAVYFEGGTLEDTTYYNISDIDSILMYQPEPVMQPGVFELTYDYFEFIETAVSDDSTRTITFHSAVNGMPLPSVGQKIVCNIFEDPLPAGMIGVVLSIASENDRVVLYVSREYDSLLSFYKQLLYEGSGGEPAMNPEEKKALAKRVVAPGLAKRMQKPWNKSAKEDEFTLGIVNFSVSSKAGIAFDGDILSASLTVEGSWNVNVDFKTNLWADDSKEDNGGNREEGEIKDNEYVGAKVIYSSKTLKFGVKARGAAHKDIGWYPYYVESPTELEAPGESKYSYSFGLCTGFSGSLEFFIPFGTSHTTRTLGVNLANVISGSMLINEKSSNESVSSSYPWSLQLEAACEPAKLTGSFSAKFGSGRTARKISIGAWFAPIALKGTIMWGGTFDEITDLDQLKENYNQTATGKIEARLCAIHAEGDFSIGSKKFTFLDIINGNLDAELTKMGVTGYPKTDVGIDPDMREDYFSKYRTIRNSVDVANEDGFRHFRECEGANLFEDLHDKILTTTNKVTIQGWTENKRYKVEDVELIKGHCYRLYPILYKDKTMMSPVSTSEATRYRVPCNIKTPKVEKFWGRANMTSQTDYVIAEEKEKLKAKVGVIYSKDEASISNLTEKEARRVSTDNEAAVVKKYGTLSEYGDIQIDNILCDAEPKTYYYRVFVQLDDTAYFMTPRLAFSSIGLLSPKTLPDPEFDYQSAKLSAMVYPGIRNETSSEVFFGMYFQQMTLGDNNSFIELFNDSYPALFDVKDVTTTGKYIYAAACQPAVKYKYQAVVKIKDHFSGEEKKYRAEEGYDFETKNPFLVRTEKANQNWISYYEAIIEGTFLDGNVKNFIWTQETPQSYHRLKKVFFEIIDQYDSFNEDKVNPNSRKVDVSLFAEMLNSGQTVQEWIQGLEQNKEYQYRIVAETNWGLQYFGKAETFKTKCVYDATMVSAVTDEHTDVTTFKATITQPLLNEIQQGVGHRIRFVYGKKNGTYVKTDFVKPSSINVSYTLPRRLDYATDYEVFVEVSPAGIDPDDITSQINGWVHTSNTISFTTPHPYRMSVPFFADLLDYQDGFTLQFQPSEECERRRLEEGQDIEFLFYLWHGEEYIDPTQDDMKDAVTELYPDSYSDSQHLGFLTYMACYPLQSYGLQPVVRVNGVSYPSEKKDVIYFKTDKPDNWVVKLLPAQMTDAEATLCGQLSPAMKAILEDTEQEYSQLNKPYLRFQYSDNAFNFSDDDWVDVPVERFDGTRFYSTLTLSDGIEARKEYYYRVKLTFESISYEYYDDPLGAKSETFKVDPFKIMNLKATADPYDGTHFTVSAEIGEAGHQMLKTDGQSHFYYFECSEDPEFSDIAAFTGYKDLKDSRMMSGEFDYVDIMTTYYVRCVITGGADGSEDQFIVSDSECKVTTSDIDPGLIIGKPEKGSKPVKKKAVK